MVFIFGTIVACGVYITTKVYGHLYDFGDKGQGQMYLNLPSALKTNSTFINPPTRRRDYRNAFVYSSVYPYILYLLNTLKFSKLGKMITSVRQCAEPMTRLRKHMVRVTVTVVELSL